MSRFIGMITLVVRDYDEAIAWYTEVLGFSLVNDTALSQTKRWVVVAPEGVGARLLLAKRMTIHRKSALATRPADALHCFSIRMISRWTTRRWWRRAYIFLKSLAMSPMAASLCSKTSTVINGICWSSNEGWYRLGLNRASPSAKSSVSLLSEPASPIPERSRTIL